MKKRCLFLGCAFLFGLTAPNQSALAQDRYEQERTEVGSKSSFAPSALPMALMTLLANL